MKQLSLFDLFDELQSQSTAEKAGLEKQSNLSSNITASDKFFFEPLAVADDEEVSYGDIYDEYEDFEVCSHSWC